MGRAVLALALVLLLAACSGPGSTRWASLAPVSPDSYTTVRDVAPLPVMTPTPAPPPVEPSPTVAPPSGVGGPTSDLRWDLAIRTRDGGRVGVVATDVVNIRAAPRLDAPIVDVAYQRHPVTVYDEVPGDPVDGDPTWYRVGAGR
ncbi:MAG: SH3 domain-containing protein, partial [Sphaerobacter sp.]|nr:SH3 domain-containing protein [Sphaerobacter sp.]